MAHLKYFKNNFQSDLTSDWNTFSVSLAIDLSRSDRMLNASTVRRHQHAYLLLKSHCERHLRMTREK